MFPLTCAYYFACPLNLPHSCTCALPNTQIIPGRFECVIARYKDSSVFLFFSVHICVVSGLPLSGADLGGGGGGTGGTCPPFRSSNYIFMLRNRTV